MTESEKLQMVIKHYAQNQKHFAELINVPQSTIASWIMRDRIPKSAIKMIKDAFPDFNVEWLLDEGGTMEMKGKANDYIPLKEPNIGKITPFINKEGVRANACLPTVDCEALMVVYSGAMEPTIKIGDIIGVRTIKEILFYDKSKMYMILLSNGESIIRRVLPAETRDCYKLVSDNPEQMDAVIPKSEIKEMLQIVFHGRNL